MSEHPNRQVTVRRGWTKANPGAQKPGVFSVIQTGTGSKVNLQVCTLAVQRARRLRRGTLQRLKSLREGCDHKYPWTGWVVFPE